MTQTTKQLNVVMLASLLVFWAALPAVSFAQSFSISPDPVTPALVSTVVTLTFSDIDPNIAVLFAPEPSPPENIATFGTQGPDTGTWAALVSVTEMPLGTYTVVLVDASDDGTCTGATSTLAGCVASGYYISTLGTFTVDSGYDPAATSTLEQAQSNLSTAFYLFLIAFFGMVWLLRKH